MKSHSSFILIVHVEFDLIWLWGPSSGFVIMALGSGEVIGEGMVVTQHVVGFRIVAK